MYRTLPATSVTFPYTLLLLNFNQEQRAAVYRDYSRRIHGKLACDLVLISELLSKQHNGSREVPDRIRRHAIRASEHYPNVTSQPESYILAILHSRELNW